MTALPDGPKRLPAARRFYSSPGARASLGIVIVLLGAALRFHALGQSGRFHADEALFSTFARAAALNGQWLFPGPLDKPPLALYASALSMALLVDSEKPVNLPDLSPRTGEFAARLPGTLAGILMMPLAYALARSLYAADRATALTALALTSFSPYAIAFAATAFTDSLMLPLVALALFAAARSRWAMAGVALGLGFLAKQQALLALPLVAGIGWAADDRPFWPRVMRLIAPVAGAAALLFIWDGARGQPDGVWVLAAANNDPWRLLRAEEVWPRLAAWLQHGAWLLGPPAVTALLLATGLLSVIARRQHTNRQRLFDLVALTYALAYVLLHWLVAFNTYERYLLLILPPAALLSARGVSWLVDRARWPALLPAGRWLVALLRSTGLIAGGVAAASRGGPLENARHRQAGIDELAAFLESRSPGAIVYDPWLGWELGYYLGQWTDKRRVYYPSPAELAAGALQQPDPAPRYFVAPAWQPHRHWLEALHEAGFTISAVYDDTRFVAYELLPPF